MNKTTLILAFFGSLVALNTSLAQETSKTAACRTTAKARALDFWN